MTDYFFLKEDIKKHSHILNGLKLTNNALNEFTQNLKILRNAGGTSACSGVFTTVAGDAQKRQIIVQNAPNLLETHNYDGLDVERDYPSGDRLVTFMDFLTLHSKSLLSEKLCYHKCYPFLGKLAAMTYPSMFK